MRGGPPIGLWIRCTMGTARTSVFKQETKRDGREERKEGRGLLESNRMGKCKERLGARRRRVRYYSFGLLERRASEVNGLCRKSRACQRNECANDGDRQR